jgi:hypothetical protein
VGTSRDGHGVAGLSSSGNAVFAHSGYGTGVYAMASGPSGQIRRAAVGGDTDAGGVPGVAG